MNKHLLNAIVEVVMFFESCDDEECDPDIALEMTEAIASHLRLLSKKQKNEFAAHCDNLAAKSDDSETIEMLEEIPASLGI